MDYSPSGLKRPSVNDTMGSTAATLRQQANSVQAGVITCPSTTTGTNGPYQITFDPPFSSSGATPRVVGGQVYATSDLMNVSITSITATKADVYLRRASGSGDVLIQWIAVGRGSEVGG